jgi:osmoprotectant transport system permease protein
MRYILNRFDEVAGRFGEHLRMTLIALGIALLIAFPLSVLITRVRRLEAPVMAFLNFLYTIPSLALLVLLIPFVGLGLDNAVIVLVTYAQVILVRNIVVGLKGVEPALLEAARGMGMSAWQMLWKVEVPLALPIILAGIRIATVAIIGIGAIAALINAGGIGRLLFDGVATANEQKIVAGSIAAATLAGMANLVLRFAEKRAAFAIHGEER